MHPSQGSKASWLRPVRQRTEEMPDLRDIHQVGWTLVPVLRLPLADKAEEPEVQGEAQGKDNNASCETGSRLESSFARDDCKIKTSPDFT
jgi:hypothetical protein